MIRQLTNNVTMKKSVIIVFLMIIFHVCCAPGNSMEQKREQTKRALCLYSMHEYENQLELFINYLGYKESRNDWTIINTINCFGEWQFTHSTLEYLGYGYITPENFKRDPSIFPRELQLKVLKILIEVNELSIEQYDDVIGDTINGIPITKSGLLAAAHLGGVGGIKLFIMSNGNIDKEDAYGTKISDYIKEFCVYDLSRKYLDEQYINDQSDISIILMSKRN